KYRNPDNPSETWAGRGLKPRWLAAALKAGKKLEYFSIAEGRKKAAKKGRKTRPKLLARHRPKSLARRGPPCGPGAHLGQARVLPHRRATRRASATIRGRPPHPPRCTSRPVRPVRLTLTTGRHDAGPDCGNRPWY